MKLGQVVYSKNGRDKRHALVVVSLDEEYVYIADGEARKLIKPKKKKHKHVQPTKTVLEQIEQKLLSGAHIEDSELAKLLKQFNESATQAKKEVTPCQKTM